MSKAQPTSVLVKLTERQRRLLKEEADAQGKGVEWVAHRMLTNAIETDAARRENPARKALQ